MILAPAKLLIYVAGPYRDKNGHTVDENIKQARKIGIEIWEAGHVAIVPHLNTAHFEKDCQVDDRTYLLGDLQILARCDAVVMAPRWRESEGSGMEYEFARENGLAVYEYPELPPLQHTQQEYPLLSSGLLNLAMKVYRLYLSRGGELIDSINESCSSSSFGGNVFEIFKLLEKERFSGL